MVMVRSVLSNWKTNRLFCSAHPGKELPGRHLFVLLVIVISAFACSRESDESVIKRYISETVAAVNAKDRSAALQYASDQMRVSLHGRQVRPQALLFYYFRRFNNVTAVVFDETVKVNGDTAEATLRAVLIAGNTVLPERVAVYSVHSQWKKNTNWEAIALSWSQSDLSGLELPEQLRKLFE